MPQIEPVMLLIATLLFCVYLPLIYYVIINTNTKNTLYLKKAKTLNKVLNSYFVFNTVFVAFVFYTFNKKLKGLNQSVAEFSTLAVDNAFSSFSKEISTEILKKSEVLLESRDAKLKAFEALLFDKQNLLFDKQITFIKTSASETDIMLSNYLNAQNRLIQKIAAVEGNSPINIIQESSIRPSVMLTVIVLAAVILSGIYFAPKIAAYATFQLVQLEYIIDSVISKTTPVAGSAKGVYFVDTIPNLNILVEVSQGVPSLSVCDTITNETLEMSVFLLNNLTNDMGVGKIKALHTAVNAAGVI